MMIEINLDAEDLACAGLRLASPDDWYPPRLSLLDALGPAPKAKRTRRASIKQIEKETGRVVTAITISPDGTRTYELGADSTPPAPTNPWDSIYETAQKRPS